MESVFESLFFEISFPSRRKVIIGEICLSPIGSVSSFIDILSEKLEFLEIHNHGVVFMGDFNINLAHFLQLAPKTTSSLRLDIPSIGKSLSRQELQKILIL